MITKYTIGHADRHSFGFIRQKHAVDLSDFQSLHAQNLISAQKHLTSKLTSVNKSKNHREPRKTTLQHLEITWPLYSFIQQRFLTAINHNIAWYSFHPAYLANIEKGILHSCEVPVPHCRVMLKSEISFWTFTTKCMLQNEQTYGIRSASLVSGTSFVLKRHKHFKILKGLKRKGWVPCLPLSS